MGWRFRRSFKIAPGVKVNFNKKSLGLTIGVRGAHYTLNTKRQQTSSLGIPGTGLYYSETKRLSFDDCACLFSKRNTDITSNIAKYSIEFHFLQGRKGQQSIAVKGFYDNYLSYCTMQS